MWLVGLMGIHLGAFAQRPGAIGSSTESELVELLYADSVTFVREFGIETKKVMGNVRFRHKGVYMYCREAIQNVNLGMIEAYGNVKIVQGDTITVTGDTLFYYGTNRLAIMSGPKTTLKDKKRTLTTRRIEYDMANSVATYRTPGKTVDEANTLSSNQGFYNTRSKIFTYIKNVKIVNKNYTLTTDSLVYESLTKWSEFRGPTTIVSKDGTLNAKKGRYNTETEASEFDRRSTVENESYTLTGDSLQYDNQRQQGYAKGNVVLVAKKDSTLLYGNEGFYRGEEGFAKVFGKALVKSIFSADTLFIRADTLYSFENKEDSTRKLIANRNVYIFRTDFQARADSVLFDSSDSIIYFFKKPILWSTNYQLEADTISAFLVNQRINRILLRANSFVISEDTLIRQFNQVKGRTINAYFTPENKLRQVLVDGNGQSAYYALDDERKLIGLNRVECGNMNILFDNNSVKRIGFIGRPDGRLIPPKDIKSTHRQLEGFNWRISDKPTKQITTWTATQPSGAPSQKQPLSENLE